MANEDNNGNHVDGAHNFTLSIGGDGTLEWSYADGGNRAHGLVTAVDNDTDTLTLADTYNRQTGQGAGDNVYDTTPEFTEFVNHLYQNSDYVDLFTL
jgi:hypothetical protein